MEELDIKTPETYNEYTYFYENARKAIYTEKIFKQKDKNWDKQIVYNFKYNTSYREKTKYFGTYEIYIKHQDDPYILDIKDIELKIYRTGIAILSFHLENSKYDSTEDILKINDYGRRIYPQFLPLGSPENENEYGVKDSFLANELKVYIDGKETLYEDFNKDYYINPDEISKTVKNLLGDKFKTFKKDLNKGDILIKPIIDDRMFTICWYKNDDIITKLKRYDENKKKYDFAESEFWHKYIYIDNGDCTCKSKNMLQELNSSHTYDRWIGKGTLYGITRYSLMMLTNSSAPNYLLTHIRTMYYQMVCIALAQRASILRFSNEVSRISGRKESDLVEHVRDLQNNYIKFINQMYFREITAQEQGIEMYNMISESMNLERDIKNLDVEIDQLHQHASLVSEQRTNYILNILTILGGILAIPTFITGFFGMNIFVENISQQIENMRLIDWINIYIVLPVLISFLGLIFIIPRIRTISTNNYVKKIGIAILFILLFLSIINVIL